VQVLGAGGGLGGPAHTGVNFGGKTSNLGASPHDWGFAKKNVGNENTTYMDPERMYFCVHPMDAETHFSFLHTPFFVDFSAARPCLLQQVNNQLVQYLLS
jgi:hypothetical protein